MRRPTGSRRDSRAGAPRAALPTAGFCTALGIAALLLGTAACGGGGTDKKFEADGIGVTFTYPSKFKPSSNISFGESAGANAATRAGVALDVDNAIIVSRYDLKATITKDNLAKYKREVDTVVGQLAHRPVNGRPVEYGGLPGYEYAVPLASPPQGQSRMAVLFDQKTEYLINCQSTPSRRDELEAACRKALDTLARK
jgi:hypothetical protein